MKTVPVRAASSITIRQRSLVQFKIADRKSLLRHFKHFIESTDWEERYLCNHWIDKMCLGGIVVSIIYFLPLLMSIIWAM